MPSKDYRIWLDDRTYIVVEFVMVRGRIVSFVARLMHLDEDGQEANVARYDTVHGTPHRDSLGRRKGLLHKAWFPELPVDVVLRAAIADFRPNHEQYLAQYLAN